jgi:hypothetical protein
VVAAAVSRIGRRFICQRNNRDSPDSALGTVRVPIVDTPY